ncbi:MAG TPA: CGNR zinc finger domain-containing protein [Nocardioides sp.]|uniref:CGNR zinc finger domain-containing protein n=1 Tax=Nocardioides sp. TaxID=35761 RepID=UPI002E2FD461|nr:CGNR zinc finger domain-containing protein [Nocardioides sp.]HEX5089297.1 CGNR zinc finger domain-containing protein [Nocardioides sp.]
MTAVQIPTVEMTEDRVPRSAALVRDFVNTVDRELGTDALESPAGLSAFLSEQGLVTRPGRASSAQHGRAVRLRRALHDALELNHASAAAALPDLDTVLGELSVRLAWDGQGVVGRPAEEGVDGALARIGLAAHEAVAQQVWWRLKVCAFDECDWAYYDQSKNRSRSYCEYGCGNKLKTRAYRARQRSARR